MDKRKTVSKPKSLFIEELEAVPALAQKQVTTLALGEEGGSLPILSAINEYLREKKH